MTGKGWYGPGIGPGHTGGKFGRKFWFKVGQKVKKCSKLVEKNRQRVVTH